MDTPPAATYSITICISVMLRARKSASARPADDAPLSERSTSSAPPLLVPSSALTPYMTTDAPSTAAAATHSDLPSGGKAISPMSKTTVRNGGSV